MSYFNDEQNDAMRELSRLAAEGKICPCGWFRKDECARRCESVYRSPEAHQVAKDRTAALTFASEAK